MTVFAASLAAIKLFTPGDLRGDLPTLEAAAWGKRWPTVEQTRGKFLFLFLVPGMNFKTFAPYLDGRPSLQGRVAFVQGQAGMAHTAFMLFDNALTRGAEISEAVRNGYLVGTRTDIDTVDARDGSGKCRDAPLASGAQIISTDYLSAPNIYANDYHLAPFAQGWRCNKVVYRCSGAR